jgi:pimeloyl-ACP methyl ester carboxylesterase/predicted glycosyltransferase
MAIETDQTSVPAIRPERWRDSTRALQPVEQGYIERDGVKVFWERFGDGEPTILFLPTWSIVDSRVWKMQTAYFGRHFRVLTIDGRGNGKSDRPPGQDAYTAPEFAADALAVMDATGTDRAITVSVSAGTLWNLFMCKTAPERVHGAVFIGPLFPLRLPYPGWMLSNLQARRERYEGWNRYNEHFMREHYAAFVEWWARTCTPEPHSEKGIEDGLAWGLQTDPETLLATWGARRVFSAAGEWQCMADLFEGGGADALAALAVQVKCPALVVEGELDVVQPPHFAQALAEATGGELVTIPDAGHAGQGRKPVAFNRELRSFVERVEPRRDPTVHHLDDGRPRALFVCSPVGLGHTRRDVAIAQELRKLKPDLEIEWLAQDPVTRVLGAEGETIHTASAHLASESSHFESESCEHDLHCFEAFRRMDEVLLANFMVFHDAVSERRYDLWVGDEAWELDYFLHEHPDEKRAPYVWLTDFVGVLPMPDDDERARFIVHDYNEQMIDHVDGRPEVRDCSLFVGNPDDIIDAELGPGMPLIRDWTERHFDFPGYVSGFDPAEFGERDALRDELGYHPDEKLCLVSVGGTGVGEALLRRVADAFGDAKRLVPELRVVIVAGPRIDPASLPTADGLEVRPYVHNLYRHLAACDVAVVQGGLTTAMELTANRRPFLYFPLTHHFEQNFHVRHRLEGYGAGRRMEFAASPPEAIAEALVEELGREIDYRALETDGARRAAERIAELL